MDYLRLVGAEKLAENTGDGDGVRIGVVDSGAPPHALFRRTDYASDRALDRFGHATAVASILLGGWGIRGLCENATPVFFKALDDAGNGSARSVAKGIYGAIDADVDLINLSLGFVRTETCPKALEKACSAAFEAGIPVICAAGNDGGPVNWPAALKTTLSVGASGENGLKTPFSSVGEVDFVAPGTNLSVLCPDGRVKTVSGTSFSAALVTGLAALLLNEFRFISRTRDDVYALKGALLARAQDVDAPGYDVNTGYGLISGKNADPTVCMKNGNGFFDRIVGKIKSMLGFNTKETKNGRIV